MKEISLPAVKESISPATAFVDEQLEALDCPMKAQMQIDVAIDEILCNVASYAYGSDSGEVTVRFSFDPGSRRVTLVFLDSGVPFDPLAKEDPDVSAPVENRAIGGLGIFLVKKTMDLVEYAYEGGKNVLTIHKTI